MLQSAMSRKTWRSRLCGCLVAAKYSEKLEFFAVLGVVNFFIVINSRLGKHRFPLGAKAPVSIGSQCVSDAHIAGAGASFSNAKHRLLHLGRPRRERILFLRIARREKDLFSPVHVAEHSCSLLP
jgi:hypothetical protein